MYNVLYIVNQYGAIQRPLKISSTEITELLTDFGKFKLMGFVYFYEF